MGLGFELAVLVLEHADCTPSVDDQHTALVLVQNDALVLLAGVDLLVEADSADQLLVDLCLVHLLLSLNSNQ